LTSPKLSEDETIPSITITRESIYEFKFEVNNYQSIRRIEASLRNKYVLGASFPTIAEASTETTVLMETSPGIFEGKLKAPAISGRYEIIVRIFDTQGNIAEKKIADVKVVKKITILSNDLKTPVEGARVLISYFDYETNDFTALPSTSYSVKNPSYTDSKGEDSVILPNGRYKASVSAIGYESKEIEFNLSKKTDDDYPTIYLKKQFNFISFAVYYYSSLIDYMDLTKLYLTTIGNSNRFFELNAISILLITLIIIFFGLSVHAKIPLNQLHLYFINLFRKRVSKSFANNIIAGKILNFNSGLPESGVNAYLIDGTKDNILYQTKTNKLGEFFFKKPKIESYKFLIIKEGFKDMPAEEFSKEKIEKTNRLIFNIKEKVNKRSFRGIAKEGLELLFALLIPGLIVVCIVIELALGYSFGWLKVFPFIIISLANFILWAKFYRPSFRNL
jgi:hypothetical protein